MNNEGIVAYFQLEYGEFRFAVDLTLPGSGVTVLLGPSGCGKTTLLRCMAGLERPPRGKLSIKGTIWQDSEKHLFVPTYRRNLGYVFQDSNLFPHLSVHDNLRFGLKRIGCQQYLSKSLSAIVALLGIDKLLDRMPERLSGGEKQRVAIARALVLNPEILLMDEPLASLDSKRKQEVMPYLQAMQQEFNMPVVYVTHSREEAAQLADHLVLLDNGSVQASGGASEIFGRLDFALSNLQQVTVVWRAAVTGHEPDYHMTQVSFNGGSLSLAMIDAPIGTKLKVQIQARDVSITLQPASHTSILNILPAIVSDIADAEAGHTLVRLAVGNETIFSHITLKSAQILALRPGLPVFVQIKGTSLFH